MWTERNALSQEKKKKKEKESSVSHEASSKELYFVVQTKKIGIQHFNSNVKIIL